MTPREEIANLVNSSKVELTDSEDKPTVLDPEDFYDVYEKHKEECQLFGINSLEDLDQFVKRMFKEEPNQEATSAKKVTRYKMAKIEPSIPNGYFPPPWSIQENEEKTEGWFAFQYAMRKDPDYYRFKDGS